LQATPINSSAAILLAFTLSVTGCGSFVTGELSHQTAAVPRVVHPSPGQIQQGQALAGSYLVTFRPNLGEIDRQHQGFVGFAAEQSAHVAYLDKGYSGDPRVKQLRFLSAVDLHRAMAGKPVSPNALGMPRYISALTTDNLSPAPQVGSLAQVDFSSPAAAVEILQEWEGNGSLWFAEPNYISHLSEAASSPASNIFAAYATKYKSHSYWWTNRIGLPAAFNAIGERDLQQANTPTDQQILDHRPIIAVFDSGVDYLHPGLANHIWTNNDPNVSGCTDDIHGCNTTATSRDQLGNGDVWPFDADGPGSSCLDRDPNCAHGTHVAGIIAGDAAWTDPFTDDFAAGVCPVCQIMILRIVGKVGTTSGILDSSIVAAFKYISLFRRNDQPAVRVVNASFGKFVKSRAVNLLLQAVKEQNGTLVIAAAGNEDSSTPEYPAAFHDAIGVAAVGSNLRKLEFSNFGPWVSLAAPGDNILSTVPGGTLETRSGTSMASPLVAGTAGLLLVRHPTLSFNELRGSLLSSADPGLYDPMVADGFNYTNYFPHIKGQPDPVPLLGRGLLNTSGAILGTTSTGQPHEPNLNRVKPGCGTIASSDSTKLTSAWWMLAPLLLIIL